MSGRFFGTSALLTASLLSLTLALPARADERPLRGDLLHGQKLYQEDSGQKTPKVDGAWLNQYPDDQILKALEEGKAGFPRLKSKNALDAWDVLAYLRSANADVSQLVPSATHMLLSEGELDQYAKERLKDKARLSLGAGSDKGRVFPLFAVEGAAGSEPVRILEKDHKNRDKLKPSLKAGYVLFVPLTSMRGGGYEAAVAIDRDIVITAVEVRGPDGTVPNDLNQAARRFVGKGGRGKYDALKAPGAGKAVQELTKPLSDGFLLGVEHIYMYEVKERDYFAFGE
jgi:hypothetical protein